MIKIYFLLKLFILFSLTAYGKGYDIILRGFADLMVFVQAYIAEILPPAGRQNDGLGEVEL